MGAGFEAGFESKPCARLFQNRGRAIGRTAAGGQRLCAGWMGTEERAGGRSRVVYAHSSHIYGFTIASTGNSCFNTPHTRAPRDT